MCATCGCGESSVRVDGAVGASEHRHDYGHGHAPTAQVVDIETAVLAKNDHLAGHNRAWLAGHDIVALNLMSSPGSGKTSLLCRTITDVAPKRPIGVIEGDQETSVDADRIRRTGAPVVQINTGSGCHLDADMLSRGMRALDPAPGSLLMIENVGNLVCPALFDLGETAKVVVISVTEGDDKPLKYPHMFAAADLVVVNKTDLLPYVDFDLDACSQAAHSVNPGVPVLPLSVRSGDGLYSWYGWLNALSGQN